MYVFFGPDGACSYFQLLRKRRQEKYTFENSLGNDPVLQ